LKAICSILGHAQIFPPTLIVAHSPPHRRWGSDYTGRPRQRDQYSDGKRSRVVDDRVARHEAEALAQAQRVLAGVLGRDRAPVPGAVAREEGGRVVMAGAQVAEARLGISLLAREAEAAQRRRAGLRRARQVVARPAGRRPIRCLRNASVTSGRCRRSGYPCSSDRAGLKSVSGDAEKLFEQRKELIRSVVKVTLVYPRLCQNSDVARIHVFSLPTRTTIFEQCGPSALRLGRIIA